jgi:hypothetical protein
MRAPESGTKFNALALACEVINVIGWMVTLGGALVFIYVFDASRFSAPGLRFIGLAGLAMGVLALLWAGAMTVLLAIDEQPGN